METVSKLDQAKKLEYQIGEATKHKELINKIILNHSDAGNGMPPISVKTNAQYSNFMVLLAEYLPIDANKFWTTYLNKVDEKIQKLEKELSLLFS